MYGTNEGGLAEGSPEAAAAVARVKAIMNRKNPAMVRPHRPETQETRTVFADWLRRAMETRGDTIASLAAALEMGPSAIGNWRAGASLPRTTQRYAIAARYGITVDRLERLMREKEQAA